jgi:hypothetical protein
MIKELASLSLGNNGSQSFRSSSSSSDPSVQHITSDLEAVRMNYRWSLAVIVVMVLVCLMLPIAQSDSAIASDDSNHAVSSSSSSQTLQGAGPAFQDGDYIYSVNGSPAVANITDYVGPGGAITIPSTLGGHPTATIGDEAFAWSFTLTSVVIPDSVVTIRYAAFRSCPYLTSVIMGNGITTIGEAAFFSCPLASIVIPGSVTTIGDDAFSYCPLISVVIPDSVISIGYTSFYYCTPLTSVTIGSGVTSIAYGAFYSCPHLASISFLGLVAPTTVGDDWIANSDVGIKGHAYAASNFPPPGGVFYGLTMGSVLPPPVRPGAPTSLHTAVGEGFVLLNWTAPASLGIPALTRYDVYRGTNSGVYGGVIGNVPVGELTYNETTAVPGTPYFYVVKAVNSIGSSNASNEATGTAMALPTVPGSPLDLEAFAGAGSVHLSWATPASNGRRPITNYTIYRGISSGGETILATIGNVLIYDSNGLNNGQPYFFRVAAKNAIGVGALSDEASATPASVPTAPRGLEATAGNSLVDLNWTEPGYLGPGMLTYHLFRNGSEIWSGTGLEFADSSVVKGATYSYQVAANNSLGWGANSTAVQATPFGPPSVPRGLTAVAGNELIDLSWTAPLYTGPGTLTYHLFRDGTMIWSGTVAAHRDSPLTKGTEHSYYVAASNSAGWSSNSSTLFSEALGVPDAPTGLTAAAGDGWVDLNWTEPSYTGPGILTYRLFRDGAEIWSGSANDYTDVSVVNGVSYWYEVAAGNSIGWGSNSTGVHATPSSGDTAPTRPQSLTAIPGDRFIELDWTEPSYLGPGTITYHLFRDGAEIWSGTITGHIDSPLTKGVQHIYSVAAQNSIGWGPNCTTVIATPFGVPDAPWNLSSMAGNGQIALSWNAVNYSGPGTLLYHLFRDGIQIWSGPEVFYVDTGVANGFSYAYNVAANNSVGWSANSSVTLAAPIGPPSEPTELTATAGNEFVNLTWVAPAYWGPGGITYHLFRDGVEIWSGTATWRNDTYLTNGMTYNYSVCASNSIGWGENSTTAQAMPFGPPTIPLELTAIPGNGNVSLKWTAPSYLGPLPLVYHVFRDSASSPAWNGSGLCWVDENLVKGTSYHYMVVASNGAGWGPNSSEESATPFGIPDEPTGLHAAPGIAHIELNWTTPAYVGPGTLTYHLYRDDAMVWSGSDITFIDTGLTGGRNYSYMVSASNSAGWGPNSTLVEVAPIAQVPPSVPEEFHVIAGDGSVNLSWSMPLASGTSPIAGYKVFRGTNASSLTLLATVTSGTSLRDSVVSNEQKYYYKVCAFSSVGDGASTEILNATPQAPISPSQNSDAMVYVAIAVIMLGVAAATFVVIKRK